MKQRNTGRPTLTTWRSPRPRYLVRELAWQRGSGRRLIGRYRYFHEACRVAERLSVEQRQLIVEHEGAELGLWLAGQRMPRAGAAT